MAITLDKSTLSNGHKKSADHRHFLCQALHCLYSQMGSLHCLGAYFL